MTGVFYLQSFYSIKQSVHSVESLVKKAYESKYNFVALSDFENLYGMMELIKFCREYKIKPIIGAQIYIYFDLLKYRDVKISFLVYAFDNNGIRNLIKILNFIQLNQKITLMEFRNFQDGIFGILSNLDFFLCNILKDKVIDLNSYENENFIFETLRFFQIHIKQLFFGFSLQSFLLQDYAGVFLNIVKKLNLKVVLVNKTNYLLSEEKLIYECLCKISKSQNENRKFINYDRIDEKIELDVKFIDEMQIQERYQLYNISDSELFLDLEKFLSLIHYNIVFSSDVCLFKHDLSCDNFEYLRKKANYFLTNYLQKNINLEKHIFYIQQLQKELILIKKMNYVDYFLIVFDLIKYAKNNKILIGPGRGSSVGSLLCFCLGITEIDPLKYNLLFERFLNCKRTTVPDIDIDVPDDQVVTLSRYLVDKYGIEHIANLITFQKYSEDLFRIDLEFIRKTGIEIDIKFICSKFASVIKGIPRLVGTHPSGLVITKSDLSQHLPIQKNSNNSVILYRLQFDHKQLEKLGFIKLDLLNLRNLFLINKILNLIEQIGKIKIDWFNILLNDVHTYNTLQRGDTKYIFQLESVSAIKIIQLIKPKTFEDLIAVLSFNRPGAIKFVDLYIKNRIKKEFNFTGISVVDKILYDTYGVVLYQEQIMRIASEFAGYDLGQADLFMRQIMAKSSESGNFNLKKRFIDQSILYRRTVESASKVYDYIAQFSSYIFNKSHGAAYALISYRMAYLKTNYLLYFGMVYLEEYPYDYITIQKWLSKIKEYIQIQKPNILYSNVSSCRILYDQLFLPLNFIKDIAPEIFNILIKERSIKKFENFYDFKIRLKEVLNKESLQKLIFAGALDNVFDLTRVQLLQDCDLDYIEHIQYLNNFCKKKSKNNEYNQYILNYNFKNAFKLKLDMLD
ncbi:MAG: PHP domain-containing protein [Pigeon pea little leaf phytoplasma]|uniref:DNA-directed DNA polymerase n=1 Tax=Candidatus Phytoplasma fabacearum TaxID=2982628 RepID=A0ABU8ZU99_9MOLU|nr:PHP domain-containing protein ['Bituminaria bituminosa' little leaf phytoplasma]MDV3154249.1 PHP domain-containing protein [Pigeon pea little leaf phytoplasma]MDO7983760.1 PHP domain-containing protein ['Bituminaria bituminosa' little leaf phytoplasma]MDO8024029.1 PHP domain-containing protein ['Bituminaria bituminosa' little leaf phytoplasma]MDO8030777.1 PHP domain-containing protein ['Bituminaria bituminosa' little leaf phytoplasma]MDV3158765.1 PHP domain-containing protein [Pigeon pea li